jgi:hypothetical protein
MGSWMNPTVRTTKKPLESRGVYQAVKLGLNLNENTGGHNQTIQRFHRPSRWLEDIDYAFVRPHFKLLAGLFVNMRTTEDRITLDTSRNRDRSAHAGVSALGVIDDFSRRRVKGPVVVRFHSDSDSIASSHLKLVPLAAPTTTNYQ